MDKPRYDEPTPDVDTPEEGQPHAGDVPAMVANDDAQIGDDIPPEAMEQDDANHSGL